MTPHTSPPESLAETARRVYGVPGPLAWAIAVFPAATAVIIGAMLAIPATQHRGAALLKEDRLVENLTFVAYFVATALGVRWALRLRRQPGRGRLVLGVLLVSAICFGLGMEEITWGQRWLHYRLPSFMAAENVQHENTIHNLEIFQDLDSWFPLFLAAGALVAIVAHTRKRRDATGVPSLLLPYAVVIVVLAGYDNLTYWVTINLAVDTIVGRLSELVEMLVAFGFMLALGLATRRDERPPRAEGARPAGAP